MDERTCAVDGCERGGKLARGWCSKHYQRWKAFGDPCVDAKQRCQMCKTDISDLKLGARYCSAKCRIDAWLAANEDARRTHALKWHHKNAKQVRQAIFDHYGRHCAECGSSENLELDHINGDGKEHRELLKSRGMTRVQTGVPFYRYLVKNNFDSDGFELRVLCGPCHRPKTNWSRMNTSITSGQTVSVSSLSYTHPANET